MARNAFITWYKMFVRLESVFEAAPDEPPARLKASFVYARTGEVPELDPVAKILFSSIRPSIDQSAGTFENISKRNRENGKKAGGPPSTKAKKKPNYQENPNNPANPEKAEDRSKKIEDRSKKIEDNTRVRRRFHRPARAQSRQQKMNLLIFLSSMAAAHRKQSAFLITTQPTAGRWAATV